MTLKNKQKFKIPNNLSQYLRLKAKEYKISENQLSKLIVPGSSGSLIASIIFDESKLSEKKIKKIADFFHENPNLLTFLAGKIPKDIHKMILENKDLQFFLLNMLDKSKDYIVKFNKEIGLYHHIKKG